MTDTPEPCQKSQTHAPERILLVGNPNVGKSVLFNLLTGRYATVSNYPGTTVEMARGRLRGRGHQPEVIDTPGINSLVPVSVDELVTRELVLGGADVVLQVIDARNLNRGLRITAELAELGVPVVVALNMVDEAAIDGISINHDKLAHALGVEVVPTVAVERRGITELFHALRRARPPKLAVPYPPEIEKAAEQVAALLPDLPLDKRGVALTLLASDDAELEKWLTEHGGPEVVQAAEAVRRRLLAKYADGPGWVVGQARWRMADELARQVTTQRRVSVSRLGAVASAATMNPILGPIILALVLIILYVVVGRLGAGTVADWMANSVIGTPPEPVMVLGERELPAHVETEPAAALQVTGTEAVIRPQRPDVALRIRLLPGPGCPTRLPAGATFEARLAARPSGGPAPKARVALRLRDGQREQFTMAPSVAGAGASFYRAVFTPSQDAVEYAIVLQLAPGQGASVAEAALVRRGQGLVVPRIYALVTGGIDSEFLRYCLVGQYGVFSMGLRYAFGIVLPIIVFFFLLLGLLEDSGYIARLSVLANRFFTKIGLSGRAVVPFVLGLGCVTMATLAARVLESPKARIIATFLLAFATPCSAQLGIILALGGAVGPRVVLAVFGVVLAQLFLAGWLANRLLPGESTDFLCEIPPLRLPLARNVLRKTWQRAEWFLREAVPYFLIGTAALAVLAWFGGLKAMERAAAPVVVRLLSLPHEATFAFIVGFLRRDYAAAGLYDLQQQGKLDNLQVVVALIVITLFVPCLANLLVIVKEQGLRRTASLAVIIMGLAVLTGSVANFAFRALGISF
ncbi:MAG: ferrous iron transporter B [Armatimonadetes bacterium]|nr:ferrous iron transporter B [Armatimonadota bacterium]